MSEPNIFDQVSQDAAQKVESPAPAQSTGNIFDQVAAENPSTPLQVDTDPSKTGEIVNDVGNKVIVPKEGESFADTMKRAVQYHKSLTPEQQQAAIDKETATVPAKTAQTLGAAATIGAVGPALLAAPGELAAGLRAAPAVGEAVMGHLEDQAAEWATKYPALTKLIMHAAPGVLPTMAGVIGYLIHKAK